MFVQSSSTGVVWTCSQTGKACWGVMAEVEQRGRQSTPPFYPCHMLKLQRSCVHAAVWGYYLLWQSLSLCVWKQIIAPHSQRWHFRLLSSEGFAALYMISSVGKCHPSKPYKWSVNHNPIFSRQNELIHDCFVRETRNCFGGGKHNNLYYKWKFTGTKHLPLWILPTREKMTGC